MIVIKSDLDGQIDQLFGNNGTFRIVPQPNYLLFHNDSILNPQNDTIYIVGQEIQMSYPPQTGIYIAAVNVQSNGSLAGEFRFSIPNGDSPLPTDIELDSNGNILVVGNVDISNDQCIFVAKLLPNGNFANFGNSGIYTENILGPQSVKIAHDCAIDFSGKIYIVGTMDFDTTSTSQQDAFLTRLNSNGQRELLSPHNNGVLRIRNVADLNAIDAFNSILINNNTIFLTGYSNSNSNSLSITLKLISNQN
ncbi:MAG: hypothetical protein ABDH21_02370 [bacterium]